MAYEPGGRPVAPRSNDRSNPRARAYALARLRQVAGMNLDELSQTQVGATPGTQFSSIAQAGLHSSDPALRWRQLSAALMQRNPQALDQPRNEDDARARMLAMMHEAQGGDMLIPEEAQLRAVRTAPLIAQARQMQHPAAPLLAGLGKKLRKGNLRAAMPKRAPRRGIRTSE